ncbi:MAG: VOC family protein [Ardenticatenaceae bacterium]|nr:VOC family protein [Ardenticatenaceae bacterium]MCB8991023.1 VOC family protein [Ardenticatenaceae bacterium]
MEYGYTIIYVPSVEDALDFYARAFGFDVKFVHESKTYGELNTGKTTLAFASHEMGEMNLGSQYSKGNLNEKPFGIELAFVTEDVFAAFDKAVEVGAVPLQLPVEKPWGQVVGYVRAVDGSVIELCSPIND